MKKLTIAYLRASTNENQNRQDVEHQKFSIEKFALKNGHKIDMFFSEYISAYKTKAKDREELMKAKQLCLEGNVENFYIFEQSRLARNTRDAIDFIDDLTNVNVKIWSCKDGRCINKEGIDKLMSLFTSYFSEQSSKDTSDRIKSQKELAKSKGAFLGHKVLLGFKIIEDNGIKKEVVDTALVPIIKELYSIYLTKGARASMDYLKDYTDKYQNNQTLLQYMSNPKMELVVGADIYEDFMTAKASRKQATNNSVKTFRSEVLLEGLLIHEPCGGKLSIDYNRGKSLIFKCRHCKTKRIEGVKKSFGGEKLTRAVEHEILNVLNSKLDKDKLIEKYNNQGESKIEYIEKDINNITRNINSKEKELEKAEGNLQKLLLMDLDINSIEMTSNIVKNMKESLESLKEDLSKRKKELAIEKLRLNKKEELAENLMNFKYLYEKGNAEQKKIILNQIISRIIVRDTEDFTIEYNV